MRSRRRSRVVLVAVILLMTAAVGANSALAVSPGTRLWLQRYDGGIDENDLGRDTVVSPDGSAVFVTGESWGGASTYDYITVAYDTLDGHELWARTYDGPGSGQDYAAAIAVDPDGSMVYVTGRSWDGATFDYATIAYGTAGGNEVWVSRYKGPDDHDDNGAAIAVAPGGGRVYVTGNSKSVSTASDMATVAYDTADGSQVWATRYNGPGSGGDLGRSIGTSGDGQRVFVTGESWGNGSRNDYATVAYSAGDGSQLWSSRYDGVPGGGDFSNALATGPGGGGTGRVYVTGWSKGRTSNDYATLAYDGTSGARLWVARYDGGGAGDFPRDIVVNPSGTRVVVTGQSFGGRKTVSDFGTISYAAGNGHVGWIARYDGPGNKNEFATSLAMSPDGTRLYVTGESVGFDDDYLTVGYDVPTGSPLWVKRYDGPGSTTDTDRATDVAVDPTGLRVYVTGWSGGDATGIDIATLAYDA